MTVTPHLPWSYVVPLGFTLFGPGLEVCYLTLHTANGQISNCKLPDAGQKATPSAATGIPLLEQSSLFFCFPPTLRPSFLLAASEQSICPLHSCLLNW